MTRRDGLEAGLVQRQLRLPLVLLERYRQQRFGTSGIALRICPVPGHDESFRLDDLAIDALRPVIVTLGPAHVEAVGAAGSDVHLKDGAREPMRTEPMD